MMVALLLMIEFRLFVMVPVEVTFMIPVTLFVRLPLLMIDPSVVNVTPGSMISVTPGSTVQVSPTAMTSFADIVVSTENVVVAPNASSNAKPIPLSRIIDNSVIPRIEVLLPMPDFL